MLKLRSSRFRLGEWIHETIFMWTLTLSHAFANQMTCIAWYHIVFNQPPTHNTDVIMTTMAFQITSLTVVYSTVYSDADQRKHQSSASLAFVWGIHRDRWIPRTKGQLRGKCFHLMTSSCVTQSIRITKTLCVYISSIKSKLSCDI